MIKKSALRKVLILKRISQKTSILIHQNNPRDYNSHLITAKKAHIIQVIAIAVINLEIIDIKENLK